MFIQEPDNVHMKPSVARRLGERIRALEAELVMMKVESGDVDSKLAQVSLQHSCEGRMAYKLPY